MTVDAGARVPRPEKVAVVEEVRDRLTGSSAAILTEYRGLPVSSMEDLRRQLAGAGGEYKVYKNTLVRRAARETGLDSIEPLLEGPTAIAFVSGDVAAVAKVLRDFARTHPSLVVKGGLIGSSVLDAKTATALAELPTREVLLAQVAGALAAPMQKFAALLAAVPQKLAYALSALVEARGGAPEAPAAEAPGTETADAPEAPTAEAPTAEAPGTETAQVPEAAAPGTETAQVPGAAPEGDGEAAPEGDGEVASEAPGQ
ncbi:MAG: 50S ribosomal protein L10 [Actinomycetota bacterium]|nr:50S ribosomal protein L10 [Actinomycetota bacterium]